MPDLKIPEAPAQDQEALEQPLSAPEAAEAPSPEQAPPQDPWEASAPKKKVRTAAEKKKLVKRIIAVVTAAALLGGIIFGMWFLVFRKDDSLGDIYAEPAYIGSIQSTVEGSGNATAKETATVTIPANGTVEQVLVAMGDVVSAGQPLFSVYSQAAQEALATAQQQMDSLNTKLANLTLAAPFAGKLMDVAEFQPGDNVGEGAEVATLVNDTRLKLSLYFSYAYEDEIWTGKTAQVSVPAVMYAGEGVVEEVNKVSFITPEGGVYFEAVITFETPGTLTAGMDVTASLTDGDGLPIFPYEQGKTEYSESRKLTTKAGGPLVSSNLHNHARVSAGQALLTMGSESLDEQLTAARERLNEAQAAVDALNATAPIDGTIISCTIAEGGEVKAGDAVVTIQNTTVMTVTIQVDDRNIGFIKLGDMITLSDYNGGSFVGTVTNVAMQGEVGQGMSTYPVTLEVDNYDGSLYAGAWLDYSMVTSQSDNCILVQTIAVKSVLDAEGNKQTVVFVQRAERPDNAIELDASVVGVPTPEEGYWPVLVETGLSDAKQVEIKSGIEDGDMVFISYTDPNQQGGMGGGMMIG